MLYCTFFGHRDISCDIEDKLYATLVKLVKTYGVTHFYVGHQGDFDNLVYKHLKKLKNVFPHIQYTVVLAYLPKGKNIGMYKSTETIFPDGLESTPPKYAINKRNQWMIDHSDVVVTYVKYPFGGAANWEEKAEKSNLLIFPLVEKIK